MIEVQVGEIVCRYSNGVLLMALTVSEITEDRIICGPWTFDRSTGAEINEQLRWGPDNTFSYIQKFNEREPEGAERVLPRKNSDTS